MLAALRGVPPGPDPVAFHARIRVPDLTAAARFDACLLATPPKQWTHRYVTFVNNALHTNFVIIIVDDGEALHHDTLDHLGIDVGSRAAVTEAHHRAQAAGRPIHTPARTTWRGTPLHDLWRTSPVGSLVETCARLTEAEPAATPADQAPAVIAGAAPTLRPRPLG